MNQQIEALRAALPTLPADKQDFAGSLLAQFDRRGDLSPKQWPWVTRLVSAPAAPVAVNLAPIVRMLERAGLHVKRPRITFNAIPGADHPVQIKLATSGRHLGSAHVTDGMPYGENRYFGRIEAEGAFVSGRDLTECVRQWLIALAADPARIAGAYGQSSGACCFCNRELTDARSLTVGYGPICADHYGLPWGEVSAA